MNGRNKRAFQLDLLLIQKVKQLQTPPEAGGCLECGTSYETEHELLLHAVQHYPNLFYLGPKPEPKSPAKDAIFSYRKTMTPIKTGDAPTMIENESEAKPADLPYFMCAECCLTFDDPDAYNSHLDVHMRQRKVAVSEAENTEFRCLHCESIFTDVNQFQEHLRTHGVGAQLSCSVCGQTFSTKFELNQHMSSHTGGTFECTECGTCFKNRKLLLQHGKFHKFDSTEPDEEQLGKVHSCKTCGKSFSVRKNLRSHQRQCTTEKDKPESCPECKQESCICEQSTHGSTISSDDEQMEPDSSSEPGVAYPRYTPVKHNMANDYLNGLLQGICRKSIKKRRQQAELAARSLPAKAVKSVEPASPEPGPEEPSSTASIKAETKDEDGVPSSPLQNDYLKNLIQSNVRKYNRQRMRDPLADYMRRKPEAVYSLLPKTFSA